MYMSWNKETELDMYNELQFFNLLDLQNNEQKNEHKNITEQAYIKTREYETQPELQQQTTNKATSTAILRL